MIGRRRYFTSIPMLFPLNIITDAGLITSANITTDIAFTVLVII